MNKFYEFFFDYLNNNDIKNIIQTGDIFDIRKLVHFQTIQWTNENFFKKIKDNNIKLFVISGNHDCVFRNTNEINSVRLLCPVTTVVVDMLPETITIDSTRIDLYPWINPENLAPSLKFANESTSKYAVGHFEFSGFPMHPGTIAEKGMNHKSFSNYEQVFSGHFHTVSQKDNIQYTGTPCQMNWSDWNDPKGFWVLDTVTGKKEFVRNPFTLFEKISYFEGMAYDFGQVKDKYVKIVIVESKNQKKFDAFLQNVSMNQPHDVKVIEASVLEAVATAVGVTDLVTTNQMLATVIDNMEVDLDKSKLKNFVLELYSEAMAINNAL